MAISERPRSLTNFSVLPYFHPQIWNLIWLQIHALKTLSKLALTETFSTGHTKRFYAENRTYCSLGSYPTYKCNNCSHSKEEREKSDSIKELI